MCVFSSLCGSLFFSICVFCVSFLSCLYCHFASLCRGFACIYSCLIELTVVLMVTSKVRACSRVPSVIHPSLWCFQAYPNSRAFHLLTAEFGRNQVSPSLEPYCCLSQMKVLFEPMIGNDKLQTVLIWSKCFDPLCCQNPQWPLWMPGFLQIRQQGS